MRRTFVHVLGLICCGTGVTAAEEPGTPGPVTIIVKATRIPLPEDRVGSSVSVISRESIEQSEATFASDLLREVPGVAVARTSSFGSQTQVRLWGAEANQALVVIDGVEANDLAGNDEFSFEHLTTFDIDRIEVIRGPQSALWGSDALAGVINIVTRRPRKPLETEAYLEGGSFDSLNGGGRIGFAADRLSLALSGSRFQTDGVNASRTGSEKDGYGNTTFNLNSAFDATAGIRLDLSARHTDAHAEYDGIDFNTGLPADSDDYSNTNYNYVRTGARASLLGTRWTHDLHFALTDTQTRSFGGGVFAGSTGGRKYGFYYQTSFRLTGESEESPDSLVTFAVDRELQKFSQRGTDSGFGNPNQDQQLNTTGVALEYLVRPVDELSLSAGLRYDSSSDFKDVLTYRGTASYGVPATHSRLHASYGTGQKSPTFLERFGYFPDQFAGNKDLKPEQSRGWDFGIEQRLLDTRLTADVTYFRARLEDEIDGFVFDSLVGRYTAVNLPGTSHRKGVQFALNASLSARYTLVGSYTYTDATQPNADTGNPEREVRRPLNAAALTLNGNWLHQRLNVNISAAYVGERQDDFYAPPTFAKTPVSLPGYTLLNLAASYQLTRMVNVYARIDNALDKRYEDVYGFNTPGFGATVGMRMRFDR